MGTALQKAGKRYFFLLFKKILLKNNIHVLFVIFPRSYSFFTFLNAPRSFNRYPFCARWACSALLYPALLTGGGTTSWDISAMNARTAAYAICRAVSSNEGGIILSKYSSSDSVFMNGIKEVSGKKGIGSRISPRWWVAIPVLLLAPLV